MEFVMPAFACIVVVFGQFQVCCDNHGSAAAIAAVDDEKHLLHSIFGTALYSLIIYGSQVFKMDWVMLSIVLLCLIAALLYGILNRLEKHFINS